MFLLTIGMIYDKEYIKDYILYRLECLKNESFDINWEWSSVGDADYIFCTLNDNLLKAIFDKDVYKDFIYNISEVIADAIISKWEERLIKRIIKLKYFYFSDKDKKYMKNLALDMLMQQDNGILQGGVYKATRKNLIMRNALEYLSNSSTIIIDGFVKFRLKNYIKELEEAVDHAFESFIAEREYKEFIKLLKYFVDIQDSKLDVIHIKPTLDNNYVLLDSSKNHVNSDYFEELKNEIIDEDINHDDVLISTLITIAPRKIIIHDIDRFKNKELIQTINNVFVDKVIICSGCDLCDIMKVGKELNKI